MAPKAKSSMQQRSSAKAPRRKQVRAPRQRLSDCVRKYAECVLGDSGAPSKVPDGACESVLLELEMTIAGAPDSSGNLSVGCFPGLPCSTVGLQGLLTGPTRDNLGPNTVTPTGNEIVLFPFPDWSNSNPAVSGTTILYNQGVTNVISARPVSYKLEVIPVGALLTQGGAVTTAHIPVSTRLIPYGWDNGTTFAGKTYAGNSAHPFWITTGLAGLSFSSISNYPGAKICSGTESCVLLGMPPDYNFDHVVASNKSTGDMVSAITTDCYPGAINYVSVGTSSATALAGPYNTATSGLVAMMPSAVAPTDTSLFGNFWWEDSADMLVWAAQNLPTTSQYEFRVRVCFELCVKPSSIYRPFVTPPEPAIPGVVDKVRNVVRALPASLPKADSSPGWWSHVTSAATGIADVISGLGIPIASGVAGVASRIFRAVG